MGTFLAKTRMKMLTTVTAMKALPHTQLNNQQTSFDSVRLKKGAPLGQMTRNFYTQQLGILKNSKNFVKNTQAQHLDEVMWEFTATEAAAMEDQLLMRSSTILRG